MKDAGMAPFKSILDHHDAEAIRAYVIQRANQDRAQANKKGATVGRSQ